MGSAVVRESPHRALAKIERNAIFRISGDLGKPEFPGGLFQFGEIDRTE
jgi:hypothetical protein